MEEDNGMTDDGSTCAYEAGTTTCDRSALTRKTMAAKPCNGTASAHNSGSEGSNPTCGKATVQVGPCAGRNRPSAAMRARSHIGEHEVAKQPRRTRRKQCERTRATQHSWLSLAAAR